MAEAQLSVAVLGAAGTIAPAIIHDLGVSDEVASMVLFDLDADKAAAAAKEHGHGKATTERVDARDVDALARAITRAGAGVLLNTASYRINLDAMRACLKAGCHYLDLGGLYRVTREQLTLGPEFERSGRLAVLGIGSSPGKTNLMAAEAVARLGEGAEGIDAIEICAAGRDPAAPADGRLRPPYAIQTLIDELTLAPVVLEDGRAVEIEPLSPGGSVDYGDPIGRAETIYTLHSELATFGASFGCQNASFRLSLAPALLERLERLAAAPPEQVAAAAREAASPSNETRVGPSRDGARGRRRDRHRPCDHQAPLRPRGINHVDRRAAGGVRAAVRAGRARRHRRPSTRAVHRSRSDVRRARDARLYVQLDELTALSRS